MSEAATAAKERRPVLGAFDRVLRMETHTLARLPELLWRQLHNLSMFTLPRLTERSPAEAVGTPAGGKL